MSEEKYCKKHKRIILNNLLKNVTRANCRLYQGMIISSFFAFIKVIYKARSPTYQFRFNDLN